mmetsp:Transcript_3305/g.7269  ORF Transcript_3305/g.7269 Transcript_3305/m.7269 type:complete len:279 (+) Transcript_3305:171-1007(+)|eukprot:CAMPEP_0201134318 /NCGR_PEP_ID=MMETSP0850-20130426/51248_1 /ASSEMBLY_ACC=CAM_ASM_000622 /TAXON_ID=183588 /ORGANISM="Pseudo-nitzschia fraudulenta, Strain WWA7" /LENGTH=278 /DNA_ID=CAMNT_0047405173 /DNA_START=255 /DNA_END=1091 /DNA_ORIENTATION=+
MSRDKDENISLKERGAPGGPMAGKSPISAPPAAPASAGASVVPIRGNRKDNNDGDLTIARAMQAIETLTSLYGFSWEAASEAIDSVSPNTTNTADDDWISRCCDYILDHGLGVDSGGAIAPIDDCPHVDGSVSVTAADIPGTLFELPCCYFEDEAKVTSSGQCKPAIGRFKDDIEYYGPGDSGGSCPKGENWWCLACGGTYCSRYVNGHGVKHYEQRDEEILSAEGGTTPLPSHCIMIGLADLSVWCHKCGSYLQTHNNERLDSIVRGLQDIKFADHS